jgi:hypothetical protein
MSDGLKTQILSMPDNPTLDAIDQLIRAPANTLITLWTMQQPEAVQQLRDTGRLTVDPEFSFVKYAKAGKRGAYAWMQGQMQKRLIGYGGELPIWALLSRPTDITRVGDQLLRIEIRKDRMLVCFHRPWERLLGIMSSLEGNGVNWPPLGPAYFAACSGDKLQLGQPQPTETECRTSWEKMFNLELVWSSGFCWSPILLQAMLPMLDIGDVRECMQMGERRLSGG